jgi:hypothetical protein
LLQNDPKILDKAKRDSSSGSDERKKVFATPKPVQAHPFVHSRFEIVAY